MKQLILSLILIGGVSSAVYLGSTSAFFSDTEVSENNTFESGDIDLQIQSSAQYAGLVCSEVSPGVFNWQDQVSGGIIDGSTVTSRPELINTACEGTWEMTDLTIQKFLALTDIKPGDTGRNSIALTVADNDAWSCMQVGNVSSDENTLTAPESVDGDVTDGIGAGELDQELFFLIWLDSGSDGIWGNSDLEEGDGVYQLGETLVTTNPVDVTGLTNSNSSLALFDSISNSTIPMTLGIDHRIGIEWCFGQMSLDAVTGQVSCDGSSVTNISQTDSVLADIAFYAEQSGNNPNFTCGNIDSVFPSP